jgi:hypothetical protein
MPIDPPSAAAALRRRALLAAAGAVALALGSAAGHAQDGLYEFISPPSASSNAVYRLNSQTGEIQGCVYQRVEGRAIGRTICYAPGSGAEAQGEGVYALHASNLEKESGVVRVELTTGAIAYCWVDFKGEQTVCTEQSE